MGLDYNQVGALLGAKQAPRPNVYDLVTGRNSQDVTTASLQNLLTGKPPSRLSENQEKTLSSLESFIKEFVPKEDAGRLEASLEGLRSLLTLGSDTPSTNLDPIFSLMVSNPDITGFLKTGTIFDELA